MKQNCTLLSRISLFAYRIFAGILSVCALLSLFYSFYLSSQLPDRYYMAKGNSFSIGNNFLIQTSPSSDSFPLSVYSGTGNTFPIDLKLFGLVNIKKVSVQVVDRRVVNLCGTPFGIKMVTQGVMVVGTGPVNDNSSHAQTPASQAGIQEGDIIISINENPVSSKKQLDRLVENSHGGPIKIQLRRGDTIREFTVKPALSAVDHHYHLGLWVRDSSAGIGTMTFYDPASECFAGLGHAICDVDTGQLMPLSQGEIVQASIIGVEPGKVGSPGRLRGAFMANEPLGKLYANSYNGVYGKLSCLPVSSTTIPMAQCHEVTEGPAKILTTVNGQKPQLFDAYIEKVSMNQSEPTKNMVIRVVDPELLSMAGGIAQGMSGSALLKDGMLVGAVTHVFVNDPTRGYAIFAENMDHTLLTLSASQAAA